MSEPVSNAEIEDVLSSIRRLVSESAGAIRREAGREPTREKLVLTPAFRVDPQEAGDEAAEAEAAAQGWDETPEAPLAEAEAEAEAGFDSADLAMDAALDAEDAAGWGAPWPEPEAAAPPPPAAEPAAPKTELERRIAELEAAIARSATEFEPDGSEDDGLPEAMPFLHAPAAAGDELQAEAPAADEAAAETGSAEEAQAGEAAEAEAQAEEAAEAEAPYDPAPEPAEAAAPGATVAFLHFAQPPRAPGEAREPETAQDWEDLDAPEPSLDAFDPTPLEAEEFDDEDDYPEDFGEAVIDEAALREMVSRMVREELQGPVGERITQNVRRMVRREIARALALQDFE